MDSRGKHKRISKAYVAAGIIYRDIGIHKLNIPQMAQIIRDTYKKRWVIKEENQIVEVK